MEAIDMKSWLSEQITWRRNMSKLDVFKSQPFIKKLISEYGFEETADSFAQILYCVFNQNNKIRYHQLVQFLREEAEAASMGDSEAQKFAKTLYDEPSSYLGAMNENPKYPIDYPGGPQHTLLKMVLSLKSDPELMVKFRCAVVTRISIFLTILMLANSNILGAEAIVNEKFPGINEKMEAATKRWGEWTEKYEKELKSIFQG